MHNEEATRLASDYLEMDPIIMYYIYGVLRAIRLDYAQFTWVKDFDYADMFFSAYQDAVAAESEAELDKAFSPYYYKAFYDEFLKPTMEKNITSILMNNAVGSTEFDAQVDGLCEAAPKIAILRPAFLVAYNVKSSFDEERLKLDLTKYDAEYNGVLNLILYVLSCCGGAARMFYAEKVSRNIAESGGFCDAVTKFLQQGGKFTNGPNKLFATYRKNYYDVLKIDEDALFRCAITIYNNQLALREKKREGRPVETEAELKRRLDKWIAKAEAEAMMLGKVEGGLMTEIRQLNITSPRILVDGLYYAGILYDDYEKKWKQSLGR